MGVQFFNAVVDDTGQTPKTGPGVPGPSLQVELVGDATAKATHAAKLGNRLTGEERFGQASIPKFRNHTVLLYALTLLSCACVKGNLFIESTR